MPIQASVRPILFFQLKPVGKRFIARWPHIAGVSGVIGSAIPIAGFTEFYCDPVNGSHLNGGSDPGTVTYTSTNGNWNGTSIFIPTDGINPVSQGIVVGQFASVYIDGATVGVYLARVTAVTDAVNGAITLSTTAKAGTPPASSATARSIKIGGALKGPSGANHWPFNIAGLNSLNDAGNHPVRFNFKNNGSYLPTTSATWQSGLLYQGYSNVVGDGGKATIDGGTTANFGITFSGSGTVIDFIFASSDTIGTGSLLIISGSSLNLYRVVVHGARGSGIVHNNSNFIASTIRQCEIYDCNKANTLGAGAITGSGSQAVIIDNCYIHDNVGSNNVGLNVGVPTTYIVVNSVFESNVVGIKCTTASGCVVIAINNDFYNNGSDVIQVTATGIATLLLRNNNFIKNTGAGIRAIAGSSVSGFTENNGYGSGSQANGSADVLGLGMIKMSPDVLYPPDVTPWHNPTIGDFTLTLPAAMGSGYSRFTETGSGKSGTQAFPDIGAAQASPLNVTAGWASATFHLPDGYLNHNYTYFMNMSTATTFSLVSGALPPGINFALVAATASLQIIGTPTTVGTYTFTIRATSGVITSDATFSITINDDPDEGIGGVGGG